MGLSDLAHAGWSGSGEVAVAMPAQAFSQKPLIRRNAGGCFIIECFHAVSTWHRIIAEWGRILRPE